MITAKTLAETKPMNNTKKERISNDKKPNRICFLICFVSLLSPPFRSHYTTKSRGVQGVAKQITP